MTDDYGPRILDFLFSHSFLSLHSMNKLNELRRFKKLLSLRAEEKERKNKGNEIGKRLNGNVIISQAEGLTAK